MFEVLYHRATFGWAEISPAAWVAKNVDFYRQHCAKRKPAGI